MELPPPPGVAPPGLPPNPPVQVPEAGWETDTVVAVTGLPKALLLEEEPEVGFPNAEMHEPTVTAEAEAVNVWRKVVVDV